MTLIGTLSRTGREPGAKMDDVSMYSGGRQGVQVLNGKKNTVRTDGSGFGDGWSGALAVGKRMVYRREWARARADDMPLMQEWSGRQAEAISLRKNKEAFNIGLYALHRATKSLMTGTNRQEYNLIEFYSGNGTRPVRRHWLWTKVGDRHKRGIRLPEQPMERLDEMGTGTEAADEWANNAAESMGKGLSAMPLTASHK